MKMKMLTAILASSLLAASTGYANPADDNIGGNPLDPMQLADNGNGMSGSAAMSGSSSMSGPSNMSGTSNNNMSGTQSNNMSGTSSPSDEGSADTATGDDY